MKLVNFKRPVTSGWLVKEGRRLDAGPFLSGAVEARLLLEALDVPTPQLRTLTKGHDGGIYNGPMFSRQYVTSRQYGVPFLSSSSMLQADLSDLPFLSRKSAYSNKLRHLEVQPGMTLISCSGTIGRMVYVREDMAGMWASQHIMKVVPDPDKIPTGYLYAYLSSKYGVPLVISGTYGAIIQHIEPEHITKLPVPRLGARLEAKTHELVSQSSALRTRGINLLSHANDMVCAALKLPDLPADSVLAFCSHIIPSRRLCDRLDAMYHSAAATTIDAIADANPDGWGRLDEVAARTFKPPIFKRLWVDDSGYGPQFVSGNDAYRWKADEMRHVSRGTKDCEQFILKRGWVIFQAAGQLNGIFGRPLYVRGWLEGIFCADDMYRIEPKDDIDGAYMFAFLRTAHGQVCIKRQASGDSIPRVWGHQVSRIRIPWPDRSIREGIAQPVIEAHACFDEALRSEREGVLTVEEGIEDTTSG